MATILHYDNKLMGGMCLLWFQRLSTFCALLFLVSSNIHLLFHAKKPCKGVIFHIKTFFEGAHLDAAKLFEALNGFQWLAVLGSSFTGLKLAMPC